MAIVIVDDEPMVRQGVRRLLESAGVSVLGEATNGGEALAMVELLNPTAVVMDGKMPVMNGVTATRYLKALHPGVKVIAHTGDAGLADELVAAGAIISVVKGSTELVGAVCSALGVTPRGNRRMGLDKL